MIVDPELISGFTGTESVAALRDGGYQRERCSVSYLW